MSAIRLTLLCYYILQVMHCVNSFRGDISYRSGTWAQTPLQACQQVHHFIFFKGAQLSYELAGLFNSNVLLQNLYVRRDLTSLEVLACFGNNVGLFFWIQPRRRLYMNSTWFLVYAPILLISRFLNHNSFTQYPANIFAPLVNLVDFRSNENFVSVLPANLFRGGSGFTNLYEN